MTEQTHAMVQAQPKASAAAPAHSTLLQRAAVNAAPVNAVPPIVHEVLTSPGQPLDTGTRAFMEPRFGDFFSRERIFHRPQAVTSSLTTNQPGDEYEHEAEQVADAVIHSPAPVSGGSLPVGYDFSTIRVHTDAKADESARAINALAYAAGKNIVFRAQHYVPGSPAGWRLLAHELTHVIQQTPVLPVQGRVPRIPIQVGAPTNKIFRVVEGIAVAGILDYERLAAQIYKAIAGLGTDEEAVYQALESLQREPAAIAQLESIYQARYRETLEQAIRGDFSGTELEYALQLINRGATRSRQAIQPAPQSSQDFEGAARRLRQAVEGWGTDEEAIFAVLTPLQRNTTMIQTLSNTYFALYRENLRDRLVDEMSGSELDYALYLLGEQRMETTDISLAEARRLFDALSHATFLTATGVRAPIPFHYPPDGCYDRAYLMVNILTQMGYASEKVFAVSQVSGLGGQLRVPTDYAQDAPPGTQPAVEWWYHVAPIIRVRTPAGAGQRQAPSTEMVLDPSLADSPITIDQWTGRMNSGSFTRLTIQQLLDRLRSNSGNYPVNQRLTFTTDRNVYFPPRASDPTATAVSADLEHRSILPRIRVYANLAQVHELAAAVRRELRRVPLDISALVGVIQAAPALARNHLWARFPDLHQAVLTAFPNLADRQQIENAINLP